MVRVKYLKELGKRKLVRITYLNLNAGTVSFFSREIIYELIFKNVKA